MPIAPASDPISSHSQSNSLNVTSVDQKERNTSFKRSLDILGLMNRLIPLVYLFVLFVMAFCCDF